MHSTIVHRAGKYVITLKYISQVIFTNTKNNTVSKCYVKCSLQNGRTKIKPYASQTSKSIIYNFGIKNPIFGELLDF